MSQLVLLGAGHAHVEVVRLLGTQKPAMLNVTLVSESERAGYSGMMPGVMAGLYRREQAEVNVPALCAKHGVRYLRARAQGIDGNARAIETDAGRVSFDIASINIGSQPWLPEDRRGIHLPVKPFAQFLDHLPTLEQARNIVVVGGGAAAVEVLLALQHRLRGRESKFTLATAGARILEGYPEAVIGKIEATFQKRGVTTVTRAKVRSANETALVLEDGRNLACDASVWATGARPHPCLANSTLKLAKDGFIAVDARQRSLSHPHIFAVGDCATRDDAPLQKSGVIPVRQGPWMVQQLIAACEGRETMPFVNRPTALALLSLGERRAVGAKGNWIFSGAWAWRWKDYLDRGFMRKYS